MGRGGLKAAFGRAPKLGNLAAEAPRPQICKFIRKTIRKMVGFQGGAQIRESGSGGAGLYRSAACDHKTLKQLMNKRANKLVRIVYTTNGPPKETTVRKLQETTTKTRSRKKREKIHLCEFVQSTK